MILSILVFWPQLLQLIAQRQSLSSSLSISIPSKMFPSTVIPSFMIQYLGRGFPRVKFAIAQAEYLKILTSFVLLVTFISLASPFFYNMRSLNLMQSPAMLPIVHIACSTRLCMLESKRSKNTSNPFFSMIDRH